VTVQSPYGGSQMAQDLLESTITNPNPFKSYKPADITLSLVAMALNMPKEG
jgi:triacylglycerol lipase